MSKSTNFISFMFGAAIGSAVTWKYIKKKYEQIAQEEIDSVRETFSKRESRGAVKEKPFIPDATPEIIQSEEKTDLEYAESLIRDVGYAVEEAEPERVNHKGRKTAHVINLEQDKPVVISPEEFGENNDYEIISLKYFQDEILTDENNEIIEDIEHTVGIESLSHFGEYEDDSVFVRNDTKKTYYEILLNLDRYYEVTED